MLSTISKYTVFFIAGFIIADLTSDRNSDLGKPYSLTVGRVTEDGIAACIADQNCMSIVGLYDSIKFIRDEETKQIKIFTLDNLKDKGGDK